MDDLNACAECGFTTQNFDDFTIHIQRHEEDAAGTNSQYNLALKLSNLMPPIKDSDCENNLTELQLLSKDKNNKLRTPDNFARSTSLNAWGLTPATVISSNSTIASDFTDSLMSIESDVKKSINSKFSFGSARALQFSANDYKNTIIQSNNNNNSNNSNTVMVKSSIPQSFSSTIIDNAKMLASIADFSRLFNNATTKSLNKTINKNSISPTIKLEKTNNNDTINLNTDLTNELNYSPIAVNSCSPSQILSNIDEINQTLPLPTSSLQKSAIASTISLTERLNTNERPRSTKIRKECPHCNFTTYMSQHMKSHLEAHERHRGQMYQCDICHTEFSQKANMHRHRTRHSGIKPYRCRFCHKEFFRKDQMQEHSMTHIKTGDDFDCPVAHCQKQFNQHQVLRQHLDEDHTINASNQACCKRCALLFSNSRRLLLHYQTKHDDFQKLGVIKPLKGKTVAPNGIKENEFKQLNTTNNLSSINILTDLANNKDSTNNDLNDNQHLSMLAVAAAISTSSSGNQNFKNLAQNYYSNASAIKRNSPNLAINSSAKRLKSGSSSPFNSISYKVEELLKNQNCLTSIDEFASTVSPTSSLTNVKVINPTPTTTGLRFLDDVMNKAFIEKKFLLQNESNNIQSENLILSTTTTATTTTTTTTLTPTKSDNNFVFGNTFNGNAALVTSIALAQKALECRNGLAVAAAAATLAASTNNTFNNNASFLTNNNLSNSLLFNSFTTTKFNNNNNNRQSNVSSINEFTTLNNERITNLEEYLPRSKSPDYQNLILNNYKMANNELLAKLTSTLRNASSAAFDEQKPLLHHMQLWTNEANSATTTTVSSLSTVENFEDDERRNETLTIKQKNETIIDEISAQNSYLLNANAGSINHHSLTHSPAASSSSTNSLNNINNNERLSPLIQSENHNKFDSLTKLNNNKNFTPEKLNNSFTLIENHLTSEQKIKKEECLLSASPNIIPSFLETNNLNVSNSLILFNATNGNIQNNNREPMECLHCGIFFIDPTLYLLHKGLHSESDAWRCNLCGYTCSDKYTFTTHLISSDHN